MVVTETSLYSGGERRFQGTSTATTVTLPLVFKVPTRIGTNRFVANSCLVSDKLPIMWDCRAMANQFGRLSAIPVYQPKRRLIVALQSYDGIVVNLAAIFKSNLIQYGAAMLSVITIVALIVCPLPFCIDCEYPSPWDHVSVKGEIAVWYWLLIAPFLAGAFPIKKGWLVPFGVVIALIATQPLGGVALWSLRENEGPFILLLGLPVTAVCFGVGRMTRSIATSVRRQVV
jgi:hypothetical protein